MNESLSVYSYEGLNFDVHQGVFSPNKTTELLLEAVLKCSLEGKSALDLGCGCGIVGITVTKLARLVRGCGSDISSAAIENAKANAKSLESKWTSGKGAFSSPGAVKSST